MLNSVIEKKYNKRVQFAIACIIFISCSPLFENLTRIVLIGGIVCYMRFAFSTRSCSGKIDFGILITLFYLLIIFGAILDFTYANEISFQSVGFFVLIFSGYLLSQLVSKNDFLLGNEKLVLTTIFVGLPIYILFLLLASVVQYGIDYKYGDFHHKTFIFLNILLIDGEAVRRFVGFGSEPGLTQIFYLLAVYSRLKRNSGRLDGYLILVLIAIFLSGSTFGLFVAVVVLASQIPYKKSIKYLIIFTPFIYISFMDEISHHLSNKLIGSDSFAFRYDRYSYFLESDINEIIFGFGNSYYLNAIAISDLAGWDSFLQLSQRYGLLVVLLLLSCLYINNIKQHKAVFVIVLTAFFTQSIWFLPPIAFFYFKGCDYKRSKK